MTKRPMRHSSIADKREALMLLTHYVGDIHQPLHVTAIYLNAKGEVVDPDRVGYKLGNDTAGGNNIVDGKKLFHGEWDAPPADLIVNGSLDAKLLQMAKAVPRTSGTVEGWSAVWANDSIKLATQVFGGLHFAMKPGTGDDPDRSPEKWDVTGIDGGYQTRTDKLKLQQIARAGARLAQLLKAIWPEDQDLPHVSK